MSKYWSQYWSEGKLTSFGESKADNYPGAIKDSWLSFFKEVGKDDRVLDIGTGNGYERRLSLRAREGLAAEVMVNVITSYR